jgi:hypothetical protein
MKIESKNLTFGQEKLIPKPPVDKNSDIEIFAVCLETDDETLLVPKKVYKIKMRGTRVRVIDEEGEAAIYPAEFFLPLSLSPTAQNTLAEVVS